MTEVAKLAQEAARELPYSEDFQLHAVKVIARIFSPTLTALREKLAKLEGSDDHPEHRCGKCGGRNIVWFADSKLWNATFRRADGSDEYGGIVCPICFANAAEERGHARDVWKLMQEVELTALREENERLKAEVLSWCEGVEIERKPARELGEAIAELEQRAEAAEAERDRLRAALEPFAKHASGIPDNWPGHCSLNWNYDDDHGGKTNVYLGYEGYDIDAGPKIADYRNAAAALTPPASEAK